MKNNTDYIMKDMPYKSAIWKLAIPAIGTFLVMSLYLTVDRLLISRIIGPEGVGALQYVDPSLQMISAFTIVVGVGARTRFSILLGRGDTKKSNQFIANSIILMLIIGFIVSFALFRFGDTIPKLFGAEESLAKMASHYFFLLSFGLLAQSIVFLFESLFQSKGYTKVIMIITAIAQVINISFDIILMKYFDMGIKGAAAATMISMYVSLIGYMLYIIFIKKEFLINPFKYKINFNSIKKILKLGSPSLFQGFIFGIKISFFTFFLTKVGNKEDVITYAAARTVIPILLIPAFGLLSATGPMLGYNYGAKQFQRMKNIVTYKFKLMISYFFICSLIIFIFPRPIMGIFRAGDYALSSFIPRTIIITLWLVAYPLTWTSIFQSSGQPKEGIFINVVRHIIIFIPLVLIASTFKDVKILMIAIPAADILGTAFTKLYVSYKIKRTDKQHLLIFK